MTNPSTSGRLSLPLVPAWLRWVAVLVVAGIILYYSLPRSLFAETLTPTPAAPADDTATMDPLAQWRHFVAYATLGATLAYALVDRRLPRGRKLLVVFVLAAGYGTLIEFGQLLTDTRDGSLRDVAINVLGVAASLSWYAVEPRVRPR